MNLSDQAAKKMSLAEQMNPGGNGTNGKLSQWQNQVNTNKTNSK